jgi:hypothetical protein
MGWRAFVVRPKNSAKAATETICPASHEFRASHPDRKPIQCSACLLCCGLTSKARDITIQAH